jgi:hypothetical protein
MKSDAGVEGCGSKLIGLGITMNELVLVCPICDRPSTNARSFIAALP